VAVVGAVLVAAAGLYLVLAGGPGIGPLGWLLVVVGVVLLPVNLYVRRRGVRAGLRHPFGRR
jgi:hypothetical protein